MNDPSLQSQFISIPALRRMSSARFLFKSLIIVFSWLFALRTSHALDVPLHLIPPTTGNVVYGNFLGISFEFSFLGEYCKSTSPHKK
jgi:hypothetical protein